MSSGAQRRLLMIEQGGRGGVADYTAELVRALTAEGWAVTLATADDHLYPPAPGVVVRPVFHYVRDDTTIGRALRRYRLGRIVNGLRFLLSLPQLVRLARSADIVHGQGWEIPQLGLLAIACLRLAGASVVETTHGTFERTSRFTRTRRAVRWLKARLTAATIVHTQADVQRLPRDVRARTVVIPHGEYGGLARSGGAAERSASRAALGIAADAPVTLVFGQLRADKGIGDVLQALRRLPTLQLLIGGHDAGGLSAVAAELESPELAPRVIVHEGFLEMSEAARLFAAADTVVLPYRAASQSGVLLLAYGFHRPVIVYPVGGLPEAVIDGQTGWICSRPDADALVSALAASIDAGWPECLRRGDAGAALADKRFSWPAIARRTSSLYRDVLARSGRSRVDEMRSARLLLGSDARKQLGAEILRVPAVRAAVRSRPFPSRPVRTLERVQRKLGMLDYERAVVASLDGARQALLGADAAASPRFLVRVDEFPHAKAWDDPARFGTEQFSRFHAIMAGTGVPYLTAVLPRVSRCALDPHERRWRALEDDERALLQALAQDGVTFALHGLDHRTRFASPRRHSELCGLSPAATDALIDQGLAELAPLGISPTVFVPPYNRFDARQYDILARRFAIVCGGPESVGLLGFQRTPMWRGQAVYLPAYEPLYGRAREISPAAERLIEQRVGLWIPIVLHWAWEADEQWAALQRMLELIAPYAASWDDFLAAVAASE